MDPLPPRIQAIYLARARRLGFAVTEFDVVGVHAWADIKCRIEAAFVKVPYSTHGFSGWFDSLKGPQQCLRVSDGTVEIYLPQLLNPAERVWFVTNSNLDDPDHDNGLFWLFQATARAVQAMIAGAHPNRYYIISKKYAWLLHRARRDELVGVGSIVALMRALLQED